jgi:hypothetical protein
MGGRIAALRQKDLPEGFAEGAARIARSAGRGQAAMGEAISKGGESVGNALVKLSGVFDRITLAANASKDDADKIRQDNIQAALPDVFEADMTKKGVPVQDWPRVFREKWAPEYLGQTQGLGVTQVTRDKLAADSSGFLLRMEARLTLKGAQKQMEDDKSLAESNFRTSLEKGDYARATEANEFLLKHNYISEGARDENQWKIENAHNKSNLRAVTTEDPDYIFAQTDKIIKGEEPDKELAFLKDDPVSTAWARNAARDLKNEKEVDAAKKFEDDVISGVVKPEEIQKQGELRGIRPTTIESIKSTAAKVDPVYDSGATTKLNTRIAVYDPLSIPGEMDSMKVYHELKDEIRTMPENMRTQMNEAVDTAWKQARDGGKKSIIDLRKADTFKWYDQLSEDGFLGPDGMDSKHKKIKDLATYTDHFNRVQNMKEGVERFIGQNPKATVSELDGEAAKLARQFSGNSAIMAPPALDQERLKEGLAPRPQVITPADIQKQIDRLKVFPAAAKPSAVVPQPGLSKTIGAGYVVPQETVAPAHGIISGVLADKEDAFEAAGRKYGIDSKLLMAIAMHETGNGTSEAVKSKNNPGGIMDPDTNWAEIKKFGSLDEGIDFMARNLKENYIDQGLTTIEQIQQKYAPIGAANDPRGVNKDWVAGVKSFYEKLGTGGKTIGGGYNISDLDERTTKNIATLKPEAQGPMSKFMARAKAWAKANGLDVFVGEGYRSPERQAELYAQGRTKPGPIVTQAKPGQSRHQSGRAIDVVITRDGKPVDERRLWSQLGKIGQAMGLEWGGSWKSIYDPEHFQFTG